MRLAGMASLKHKRTANDYQLVQILPPHEGGRFRETGSRFLMCQKSAADHRFQKYSPQPVVQCGGFEELLSDVVF
jgi:hypothetical protein